MEKTFEKLAIDESYEMTLADEWVNMVTVADVVKLLQQVREATIAECVEILRNPNIPKSRMESLPTDRIKTEK